MILMYSFFNNMGTILVLIFKNTSSKQQSRTLTLSNYALKKTGTLSLFVRIPSDNNQLTISRAVQMLWRILSASPTLLSISTFSPSLVTSPKLSSKHKVLELRYKIYPDKSTHRSHYPRFDLTLFLHVVAQKSFLVKLEICRLKVDLTTSCHRFAQQAELYKCTCIARLTKYLWRIQNVNKNTTF